MHRGLFLLSSPSSPLSSSTLVVSSLHDQSTTGRGKEIGIDLYNLFLELAKLSIQFYAPIQGKDGVLKLIELEKLTSRNDQMGTILSIDDYDRPDLQSILSHEKFLISCSWPIDSQSISNIPLHVIFKDETFVLKLSSRNDLQIALNNNARYADHPRWKEICQRLDEMKEIERKVDWELLGSTWESLPGYLNAGISIQGTNLPTDGKIIWSISSREVQQSDDSILLAVVDDKGILHILEPAFTNIFLKYHATKVGRSTLSTAITPSSTSLIMARKRSSQPVGGASSSLSPATSSTVLSSLSRSQPSIHHNSHPHTLTSTDYKTINKTTLKKLILLSLRHVGVDRNHGEFTSIWKHLYCACLFALRRELATELIEQSVLLTIIRSNMNFLNIK